MLLFVFIVMRTSGPGPATIPGKHGHGRMIPILKHWLT